MTRVAGGSTSSRPHVTRGGGGATAKYGRFLLIKAGMSVEEERRVFCSPAKKENGEKKVKRLLDSAVQQRVPESEWVDEGLNGLEGKLGMCVSTDWCDCVCICVCVCVQVCWSLCVCSPRMKACSKPLRTR